MHCDNQISYKELLRICQTNKDLAKKYITDLYERYNPIYNKLNVVKPLLCLLSFVPLPYDFDISYLSEKDQIKKLNNIYTFLGQPGDRIMYGNRRLPNYRMDSIPFTIPITIDDEVNLIQSNVFYYEVTILNTSIRKSWNNECISIGFGTKKTPYKSHVGWTKESWGFHSDDGNLMNSNQSINITSPWSLGETIGVGLVYEKKNEYRILFTKNGIIIDDTKFIKTEEDIYPMIGYDLSSPIFVNWGQKQFKFQLNNYICSNQIINNKNTFLSNSNKISDYDFIPNVNLNKKINIMSTLFPDKILKITDYNSKITDYNSKITDFSSNSMMFNKIIDISSHSLDNTIPLNFNSIDLSAHLFQLANLDYSNNLITNPYPQYSQYPLFYTLSSSTVPFYNNMTDYILKYISITSVMSTDISGMSTNTIVMPTNTTVIPMNTSVMSTNTTVIPMNTSVMPTNITVMPTNTSVIPTNTSVIPHNINSDISTNDL